MTSEERAKTLCSLMRGYGTPLTSMDEEIITAAIKVGERDARAAGYAEAKEQAAKEAVQYADWAAHCAIKNPDDARSFEDIQGAALEIADAIRAIAPATTKEPT